MQSLGAVRPALGERLRLGGEELRARADDGRLAASCRGAGCRGRGVPVDQLRHEVQRRGARAGEASGDVVGAGDRIVAHAVREIGAGGARPADRCKRVVVARPAGVVCPAALPGDVSSRPHRGEAARCKAGIDHAIAQDGQRFREPARLALLDRPYRRAHVAGRVLCDGRFAVRRVGSCDGRMGEHREQQRDGQAGVPRFEGRHGERYGRCAPPASTLNSMLPTWLRLHAAAGARPGRPARLTVTATPCVSSHAKRTASVLHAVSSDASRSISSRAPGPARRASSSTSSSV